MPKEEDYEDTQQQYGERRPEDQVQFETAFIQPVAKSNEGEVKVDGKIRKIEELINNVFTRDLTTTNFSPEEYNLILGYLRLCQFLKTVMLETHIDYTRAINFYIEIVQGKCNAAKSKSGWSNIMSRSKFMQSEVIETLVQQAVQEMGEEQKEGVFSKIKKGLGGRRRPRKPLKEVDF